MIKTMLSLLCMSLPASASAASWVSVASCGNPGELRAYSYDPGSIQKSGAARSVKVHGDYSKHATSRAREADMLWSFDCSRRTFVEANRREYDRSRQVLENHDRPTAAMTVMPNSVADKVFGVVCA